MSKKKHQRTFDDIFARPRKSGVIWDDVIKLLEHLGASVDRKRAGSRVGVALPRKGSGPDARPLVGIFHEPHPEKETDKGALSSIERLLKNAGYSEKDRID